RLVAAGFDGCGVDQEDHLRCVRDGALVQVAEVPGAVTLSWNGMFGCARTAAGAIRCWGDNHAGQIGIGHEQSFVKDPTEVTGLSEVIDVSVGGASTCAVTKDGVSWCWGSRAAATGQDHDVDRPSRVPDTW